MATKEEIRPLYAEVLGCLVQAPGGDVIRHINDPAIWEHYNQCVDRLIELTKNNDYQRFRLTPTKHREHASVLDVAQYRTKLGSLLSRLHAEFFQDEVPPFAGSPGMVINQTQQQNQSVHVQIIMDITERLTRSEASFEKGTKERGFIDKVKGRLKSAVSGTTNVAQLMLLLLNVAKESGLSVEDMQRIFGG